MSSNTDEIIVKFMSRGMPRGADSRQITRMLPGREQRWENCRFVFDVDCREYDWLVVYHDIPKDGHLLVETKLACPREHTMLLTPEPSSVTVYGTDYFKQFGTIVTYHEPWVVNHPDVVYCHPGMVWYYGFSYSQGSCSGYDELKAEEPCKTKTISMMCSNRVGTTTLHSRRVGFAEQLKEDVPELDRFGHGFNYVDDKADALRPYRYHVVIENHKALHHLTEKLPDAFLGYTLPFYHGAPNAHDYFPREGFIPIDITDYERSLDIIRSTIANNEYEDRLPYIQEARRRALEEMNMFAIIHREIMKRNGKVPVSGKKGVIRNRQTMRVKNPAAGVRSLSEKVYVKTRHRLKAMAKRKEGLK